MMSYSDALKKAKSLKHDIEKADEYEGGYVFMSEEDAFSIGGGTGPCCVLKSNGKAIDMTAFMDDHAGEWIREMPVE